MSRLSDRVRNVIKNGRQLRGEGYALADEACELHKKCIKRQDSILDYMAIGRKRGN